MNPTLPKPKMSAHTRLMQTFDAELIWSGKSGLFDKEWLQGCLKMLEGALKQRDANLRAFLLFDGVVAIMISGKDLKIPGTDLTTSSVPGVLEVATVISSFGLLMFVTSFINVLSYQAIIQALGKERAVAADVDPDFLHAALMPFEFVTKVFRQKYNIWGEDFFVPGASFTYATRIFAVPMFVAFLVVPIAHWVLLGYSVAATFGKYGVDPLTLGYAALVFLLNLGAAAAFIGFNWSFEFTFRPNARVKQAGDLDRVPDGALPPSESGILS